MYPSSILFNTVNFEINKFYGPCITMDKLQKESTVEAGATAPFL